MTKAPEGAGAARGAGKGSEPAAAPVGAGRAPATGPKGAGRAQDRTGTTGATRGHDSLAPKAAKKACDSVPPKPGKKSFGSSQGKDAAAAVDPAGESFFSYLTKAVDPEALPADLSSQFMHFTC